MNVLIATPLYDRPEPEMVSCVEATRDALRARGDYVPPWMWLRGGLVQESRNAICARFLQEPFDVLVQIDHDHTWRSVDVMSAVDFVSEAGPGEVCGFAHPMKQTDFRGPLGVLTSPRLLPDRPIQYVDFKGQAVYAKVGAVGGGILVTSRLAIETVAKNARILPNGLRAVFDIAAGTGEDVQFCATWRKLGGTVYCDLHAQIGHIGRHVYRGSLGDELRKLEAREAARSEAAVSGLTTAGLEDVPNQNMQSLLDQLKRIKE